MNDDDFLQNIKATADTGHFFVQLAQHAEQKGFDREGDLSKAASAVGLRVPREFEGATFELLDDRHIEQLEARKAKTRQISIGYPPEKYGGAEVAARTFKKCFKVCKTVGPAKVCKRYALPSQSDGAASAATSKPM